MQRTIADLLDIDDEDDDTFEPATEDDGSEGDDYAGKPSILPSIISSDMAQMPMKCFTMVRSK